MRLDLAPWAAPPARPVLEAGHLHLWRFRLDLPLAEIEPLKQQLSDEELVRAARLLDPVKGQNFIAARARLRQILAQYLDQSARSLQFSYGPLGKPHLVTSLQPVFFNLSHARSWALLAITGDGEVGVDIEYINPEIDHVKIARQFLSAPEWARLANAPPARQHREFYRLWTAREAVLKASGCGFSIDSTSQDHHYLPRTFPLARNYLATLAAESRNLLLFRWDLAGILTN